VQERDLQEMQFSILFFLFQFRIIETEYFVFGHEE